MAGLKSIYFSRGKRLDVTAFNNKGQRGNYVTPDFASALIELEKAVNACGGNLYVTDLFRSFETQRQLRERWEAGKQKAFAANPGGSFHNAGRAIDVSLGDLDFDGIKKEDWLKKLWELAKPLGFKPIIKKSDMNALEAWHFDFPGKEWAAAYDNLNYSEVAKCCILDVGEWAGSGAVDILFLQSQLMRLGFYEIGFVDGILGPKTKKAVEDLGFGGYSVAEQCELIKRLER